MDTEILPAARPADAARDGVEDAAARAMIARAEQAATAATGFEGRATLMNPAYLAHLQRLARMFLAATMTPDHFKPSEGKVWRDGSVHGARTEAQCLGDIAIVLDMANQLNVAPFQMLQNTYVVQGRPGMSTALLVSLVNTRGVFAGPIRYDVTGEGKTLSVTAWAIARSDGARVESTVTMALADAEGWTKRKKEDIPSKYETMPVRMLQNRAATWLVRTYHPEVVFGLHTVDELEDAGLEVDAPAKPQAARAEAAMGGSKAAARLMGGGA